MMKQEMYAKLYVTKMQTDVIWNDQQYVWAINTQCTKFIFL